MRIVSTKFLNPGMVLGKNVYGINGVALLKKDTILKDLYINSLLDKNIPSVYIRDHYSEGIEVEEVVDLEVRAKAVFSIKNIFDDLCHSKQNKKTETLRVISGKHYGTMKKVIDDLTGNLIKNKGCLMNMVEVMSTDLYTYSHSANVAILAMLTARSLNMSGERVREIGMGALLHDIGKVTVPDEILNKEGRLTKAEMDMIKDHPAAGYRMVKDDINVSAYTKSIVLLHHERLDGSGYPFQFTGEKIPSFVRIVSICDAFDAMVSNRCYRGKMPVYEAVEILTAQVHNQIDHDIFRAFIGNISVFPPGITVKLNTGEVALVVESNPEHITRPKLRIIADSKGNRLTRYKELDLMKELTVFIQEQTELQNAS